MENYDGAEAIERAWREGLKPDPLLTVSQWADQYRVLSQRASSEPGRWRTERTPYLKEIMDCLSPSSPVQRVVFMKGSQTGGTEAGNCWIGYVIHQAPGPMMAVAPTVELAKRNSRQRIDPLIEESNVLQARVKERRSRDSGNTVLSKEFPGGVLILTGANSAVGLRSMPARYLFLDEVDGYPGDVEGEGDPILLAERRSATFQRRKILLVSTPKTKSLSRIEREYDASDQRRYFVPCPHCHERQTLELANLRWPEGRPREADYACAHCGVLIGERHKTWMLEHGEWRSTTEGDGRTRTAVAVKGRDRDTALLLSVSKADAGGERRGLRVWSVGTPVAKGELYRWLKLEWPTEEALEAGASYPPGACHFPQYGEEYFRQLTAERLVTRIVKGFPRGSWEKEPGRRNEALDCRVYARAAAAIFGLDRFEEWHWRRMEEALARTTERDDHQAASPRTPAVRPPARQVIHSGYMAR